MKGRSKNLPKMNFHRTWNENIEKLNKSSYEKLPNELRLNLRGNTSIDEQFLNDSEFYINNFY
jgi:hypothetical protein